METIQAYGQQKVKLPLSGTTVVINELDAIEALRFGGIIGGIGAGALIGMGSYKRNSSGGFDIHLGESARGLLDRLFERPDVLQDLVRASMLPEAYSEEWFKLTFRARNLPDLYFLVEKILTWNFGPVSDHLKKKTGEIIRALFLAVELQSGTK